MLKASQIRGYLENRKYLVFVVNIAKAMGISRLIHSMQDREWRKKHPHGDQCTLMNFKTHENELHNIYCMLSDEKSKIVYENMIRFRILHDRSLLKGIVDKEQYFASDIVDFYKNEVMIDCGAYDGDTIREFLRIVPRYNHIYALEPDVTIGRKIPKDSRITVYQVAAWNKETELCFNQSGIGTGNINNKGTKKVRAVSIDYILQQEKMGGYCSFIKMDIEGSELKALMGAENTIKRYKPKLAICIYHKDNDFWEIPQYIQRLVPEYKFYVRQYSDTVAETVLYAVL